MPKPTSVPEWATGGSTAEPSPAKKAIGHVPGERMPAQYMNWWQLVVYNWIAFLNGLFTTVSGLTHLTLDGGYHHTNTEVLIIPATLGRRINATNPQTTYILDGKTHEVGTGIDPILFPVPITKGDRITQWKLYVRDTSNGGHAANLFKFNGTTAAETAVGISSVSTGIGYEVLGNLNTVIDVAEGDQYFVRVVPDGGAGIFNVFHLEIGYTHP